MTRSETFREIRTPKPANRSLGFRLRKQVRPGHADHIGGRFSSLGPLGIIQLALLDLARAPGVVSWFEFIDFRCDIVVGSLFGGTNSWARPRRKSRSLFPSARPPNLLALRPIAAS